MIAGAKINLCLRVGPLRDDGYHDVATVIAALALGDDVKLEPADATQVEAPALAGGDTIVTRALALAGARARATRAGGAFTSTSTSRSARDSAAGAPMPPPRSRSPTRRLPEPLAPDELIALAAEVGSDVPFFVSGRETALARGRGELLEPCPVVAPAWVVVAWPGVSLGTAEVYARYRPAADAHGARRVAGGRAVREPATSSSWRRWSRTISAVRPSSSARPSRRCARASWRTAP